MKTTKQVFITRYLRRCLEDVLAFQGSFLADNKRHPLELLGNLLFPSCVVCLIGQAPRVRHLRLKSLPKSFLCCPNYICFQRVDILSAICHDSKFNHQRFLQIHCPTCPKSYPKFLSHVPEVLPGICVHLPEILPEICASLARNPARSFAPNCRKSCPNVCPKCCPNWFCACPK